MDSQTTQPTIVDQAAGIAHHAGRLAARTRHQVVVATVQVPVQPQVGARNQIIVGIAEARRARLRAVARVGAAQAGRKVGDDQRLVPAPSRRALRFELRIRDARFITAGVVETGRHPAPRLTGSGSPGASGGGIGLPSFLHEIQNLLHDVLARLVDVLLERHLAVDEGLLVLPPYDGNFELAKCIVEFAEQLVSLGHSDTSLRGE